MTTKIARAMNSLEFSPTQLEAIRNNVAAALEREADALPAEAVGKTFSSNRRRRTATRRMAAILVAAAMLGLGGLALAAGITGITPTELAAYFFRSSQTAEESPVNSLGASPGISQTASGVTVTLDSIVSDRYNIMLVFSIVNEDESKVAELNPELGPGMVDLRFWRWQFELGGNASHSRGQQQELVVGYSSADFDPYDNALQMIYTCSSNTTNPIDGGTARVLLGGLCTSSWPVDAPTTDGNASITTNIIAEGPWTFAFDLDRADSSVELDVDHISFNGMHGDIVKAVASATGLTLWHKGSGTAFLHSAEPLAFNLKDGTSVRLGATRGFVSPNQDPLGDWDYVTFVSAQQLVDISQVASVTIGDTVIPLEG